VSPRVVRVEPDRLTGWFDRFAERHGGVARTQVDPRRLLVTATDGATADIAVPYGPLTLTPPSDGAADVPPTTGADGSPPPTTPPTVPDRAPDKAPDGAPDMASGRASDGAPYRVPDNRPGGVVAGLTDGLDGGAVAALVAHLLRPRRVALLLVRLGGHSVGVAVDGAVERSSTDRRLVHGRHRAGGSSSGRFARRREGQARVALQAAADTAARVLLPELPTVDAVVLGGDRRALELLRADPRLTPLFDRAEPVVLDVPRPRRTVLDDAAHQVRCARIVVTDP
jgi:hypothetical protein